MFNIRCDVLDINTEIGRIENTPRVERICSVFNMNTIENEYIFLLVFPCYRDLITQYLKEYYYLKWDQTEDLALAGIYLIMNELLAQEF